MEVVHARYLSKGPSFAQTKFSAIVSAAGLKVPVACHGRVWFALISHVERSEVTEDVGPAVLIDQVLHCRKVAQFIGHHHPGT